MSTCQQNQHAYLLEVEPILSNFTLIGMSPFYSAAKKQYSTGGINKRVYNLFLWASHQNRPLYNLLTLTCLIFCSTPVGLVAYSKKIIRFVLRTHSYTRKYTVLSMIHDGSSHFFFQNNALELKLM